MNQITFKTEAILTHHEQQLDEQVLGLTRNRSIRKEFGLDERLSQGTINRGLGILGGHSDEIVVSCGRSLTRSIALRTPMSAGSARDPRSSAKASDFFLLRRCPVRLDLHYEPSDS